MSSPNGRKFTLRRRIATPDPEVGAPAPGQTPIAHLVLEALIPRNLVNAPGRGYRTMVDELNLQGVAPEPLPVSVSSVQQETREISILGDSYMRQIATGPRRMMLEVHGDLEYRISHMPINGEMSLGMHIMQSAIVQSAWQLGHTITREIALAGVPSSILRSWVFFDGRDPVYVYSLAYPDGPARGILCSTLSGRYRIYRFDRVIDPDDYYPALVREYMALRYN